MKDPRCGVGTALLLEEKNQILLLKRADDASHGAGKWALPGGWLDYGEQPVEGVAREAYEEVGVTITRPTYRGFTADTHLKEQLHVVCLFFSTHRFEGTPQIMEPDKATDLLWVPRHRVKSMDLFLPLFSFVHSHERYFDV